MQFAAYSFFGGAVCSFILPLDFLFHRTGLSTTCISIYQQRGDNVNKEYAHWNHVLPNAYAFERKRKEEKQHTLECRQKTCTQP
jgi:hypothetical protein